MQKKLSYMQVFKKEYKQCSYVSLFQYSFSSPVKNYINSSIFPLDIKFQHNSRIFRFSSFDGHPATQKGTTKSNPIY